MPTLALDFIKREIIKQSAKKWAGKQLKSIKTILEHFGGGMVHLCAPTNQSEIKMNEVEKKSGNKTNGTKVEERGHWKRKTNRLSAFGVNVIFVRTLCVSSYWVKDKRLLND